MKLALSLVLLLAPAFAQLKSGPPLNYQFVPDWPKLPKGWNFGECSGVTVDGKDNVWVFNRGAHPVIQFDKRGTFLQAWTEVPIVSSHGIKADKDGNIWLIDVRGHKLTKHSPDGRILMVISNPYGQPGNNDSEYAFNQPTGLDFGSNGDVYVSDGYVNARVIKFNRDGMYLTHWGKKGTGDSEFDISHDVALDSAGRVYVADRTNARIQIFDGNGKFLGKWTDLGNPWGLAYSAKDNTLFMADGHHNRVLKLNLDGQIIGELGSFGKTPGKFDFAHHMAVDSTGAIYVAEIKNWRVQKFAPR